MKQKRKKKKWLQRSSHGIVMYSRRTSMWCLVVANVTTINHTCLHFVLRSFHTAMLFEDSRFETWSKDWWTSLHTNIWRVKTVRNRFISFSCQNTCFFIFAFSFHIRRYLKTLSAWQLVAEVCGQEGNNRWIHLHLTFCSFQHFVGET